LFDKPFDNYTLLIYEPSASRGGVRQVGYYMLPCCARTARSLYLRERQPAAQDRALEPNECARSAISPRTAGSVSTNDRKPRGAEALYSAVRGAEFPGAHLGLGAARRWTVDSSKGNWRLRGRRNTEAEPQISEAEQECPMVAEDLGMSWNPQAGPRLCSRC
jgi:hypothetical protein